MPAASISFPGLSAAEASIAAQELRDVLIQAGVPANEVDLVRADANAQDLGNILMVSNLLALAAIPLVKDLAWEGVKGAAGEVGAEVARRLIQFFKRTDRKALINVPGQDSFITGSVSKSDNNAMLGKAGVVILGASKFPSYSADRKLDNPAFAKSAELMKRLLADASLFRSREILDYFDKEDEEVDVLDGIDNKIGQDDEISDVFFYYCGHGHLQSKRSLHLMLRNSRPGREAHTGLDVSRFLGAIGSSRLAYKRCYFILDCCYATEAVRSIFPGSYGSEHEHEIPPYGTAFLTASNRSAKASGKGSRGATMFSGALADVLLSPEHGVRALSFRQLYDRVWQRLIDNYKQDAVLPECDSPDQSAGDIAVRPFVFSSIVDDMGAGQDNPKGSHGSGEVSVKQSSSWVRSNDADGCVSENNDKPTMQENSKDMFRAVRGTDASRGHDYHPYTSPEGSKKPVLEKSVANPPRINPKLSVKLSPFYVEKELIQNQLAEVRVDTSNSSGHGSSPSSQDDDIQWYIARDNKQHGPLTDIEMRTFVHHHYLRSTDFVWKPGMTEWQATTKMFPEAFSED